MITLTDTDVVRLLRKNNLNSDTLQENVVAKLREKGVKLATAESCTGGLLSERITAVSGASDVFDFGVCTYANEMKHKVLGVSNETLSVLGAVSAETAMQMAEGARNVSGADLAVSTTGIAGPTGGTPEKPVGLVYCGISTKDKSYAIKLMLGGSINMVNSRGYIRKLTSDAVLLTILSILQYLVVVKKITCKNLDYVLKLS